MDSYRSPLVAALAAQLLRSPVRLRLKQLLGIDFLSSVIETDKSYPYDFVCHAITGFRARSGEDSRLIDGATLTEDLLLLAQELSGSANLSLVDLPERMWSVNELSERFDVSTKTIFRWHRRGMVGWRLRCVDQRVRLVFPDRCVQRFVVANAALVARGTSFSQLSTVERERIIARGRDLAAAGEKTVNSVAKVIAGECGRAVETIRLILKQFDDAHPSAGIFNRSQLQVEPDDQRLAVWEAYNDGAGIESLARRFGRPTQWIYSTITQMRARELRVRLIEFIPSPEFEAPDADTAICQHPVLADPSSGPVNDKRVPAGLPPYLRQLFSIPLLSPLGEQALFRKMNFLKFKADRMRREVDPETVSASELDRIEALISDAAAVKNQIVQSNLRLVVSIAKRHVQPGQDFFEVVSDGNVSLMRAVDKFDYTRGYKFSTYCSWAVMKNYARTVPEQRIHRDRYQTGRTEMLETVPGGVGFDHEHEDDFLPAVRATLDRLLSLLDEREQSILRQRYGLDNGGQPATLDQIGQRFGVSKERIRQLEVRAMTKLRQDLTPELQATLGL